MDNVICRIIQAFSVFLEGLIPLASPTLYIDLSKKPQKPGSLKEIGMQTSKRCVANVFLFAFTFCVFVFLGGGGGR